MQAWMQTGKPLRRNQGILCNQCPCFFEVFALENGSCGGVGDNLVSLGRLSGSYRLTYVSGAIRTVAGAKWNYPSLAAGCMTEIPRPFQRTYIGIGGGEGFAAPGFDKHGRYGEYGWSTAEEAEVYNTGKYKDYSFFGEDIYMWYDDDIMADNQGSIVYKLSKN